MTSPPPIPSPPLLDSDVVSPSSPPPPPLAHHHHHHRESAVLLPVLAGVLVLAFFIVFGVVYRKLSRKRTAPADLKPPPPPPQLLQPQKYSYAVLRRATGSFAAASRLGQGGFGSVFKGVLPSGQEIAVKLMDSSGSLQGEREFHNELSLSSRINSITCCPHVVSVLGFSSDQSRRRRRRMMLVYEYMQNGSLQDALLSRKCSELIDWRIRFKILLDIAKGIEFLHFVCDPPIVHSDIKPSNVLLDSDFNAKIADFGLAGVLNGDDIVDTFIECGEEIEAIDEEEKKRVSVNGEETGSVLEEVESVMTEEVVVNIDHLEASEGVDRTSVSDSLSVDSGKKGIGRNKSGVSGRDWWWKQDNGGGESGRVKDYVMEWIGSEIKKERPKKDWITNSCSGEVEDVATMEQTKQKKILEKEKKNRKPREWWKEEFCDELVKKKKKKGGGSSISGCSGEMWWQKDEEFVPDKKKRKSKASLGSIDSWLDGFSGEFRIGRRNSQDFTSGDIPKSGGISSTPSMRGTVCYIAPEKCDGGRLSEKCDVYSFGVLVLVLISGRRPLQVTASPMSEFERANLISWARQLARNAKLLDLVDPNIQSLDQEQALMCITIALLCLQRSPGKRPTMREIVQMLSGEGEPPHLPFEFSPSPPSNFPFKSRKKAR